MYRLLIVDDEPIIVEGLQVMFQSLEQMPFEIYVATNAYDALEIAKKVRIDILLSDIEMPEMNGIELQQEMSRYWPRCRVVFLSGYNEFSYIQSSIRGGAMDYVMKTEGDEVIIAAVEKTVQLIAKELKQEQLIGKAREELTLLSPMLRKEYLLELVSGSVTSPESRKRQFAELNVPLHPEERVFMIAGRIDEWRDGLHPGDNALFLYSINNIFEEFFAAAFYSVYLVYAQDRFLWLMQPKSDYHITEKESELFVLGTVEAIQAACKEYLKLSCSFIVGSELTSWERLPEQLDRFSVLFARGLGISSEMLLTDQHVFTLQQNKPIKTDRIHMLGMYLDWKDQAKFNALYKEFMDSIQSQVSLQTGIALEIFYSLSSTFVAYMNRWDLFAEFSAQINMKLLFSIEEHASWQKVVVYFQGLAEMIFARSVDENAREMNEVVNTLHSYIESHLHEDVSLTQLSDVVYLTTSYLSRLYKQKTGQSITDYIIKRKIQVVKQLLCETNMKIQDIGDRIGYGSPSYFSRFFKRETEFTPQEYRDAFKTT